MERKRLITTQVAQGAEAMMERMNEYASKSFSYDLEDNDDFVRCVAVPVRNQQGRIIASVSVTSIKEYMPDERMASLIPLITSYCEIISQSLN